MGIGIFLLNCLPNQQKLYIFVPYDNCFFKLSWLLVFTTHSWVVFLCGYGKKSSEAWRFGGWASTSSATALRELRSQTFSLCSATGLRELLSQTFGLCSATGLRELRSQTFSLCSATGLVNYVRRTLVCAQPPGL